MFGSDNSDSLSARVDLLESQLERIERKLDQVLVALGATPGAKTHASGEPAWMEQVREQLRVGKKILAIKIYREHTGLNLKESKKAVESLQSGGSGSAW